MSIIGMIGGIAGAAMGQKNASDQMDNQEYLMGQQNKYNEEMAQRNQERNKEMWDYTNYENQRKHLENAGLNTALMYGMSGGGGASTSGAQGQGVSQPQDKSIDARMQSQAMGLQIANMKSQIEVNEANANKLNAEANKTKGVDTQTQEATLQNIIAQTKNEELKQALIKTDTRLKAAQTELEEATTSWTKEKTDETTWNITTVIKRLDNLNAELEGAKLDNTLKSRTMETEVKKSEATLKDLIASAYLKMTIGKVNEEEKNAIGERLSQTWSSIKNQYVQTELNKIQVEQAAEKIMNDLTIGKGQLDIEDRRIIKDYILGFINVATKGR